MAPPMTHFQSQPVIADDKPKRVRRIWCDECGQNCVEKRGDICEGCDAYREHTGHF